MVRQIQVPEETWIQEMDAGVCYQIQDNLLAASASIGPLAAQVWHIIACLHQQYSLVVDLLVELLLLVLLTQVTPHTASVQRSSQ